MFETKTYNVCEVRDVNKLTLDGQAVKGWQVAPVGKDGIMADNPDGRVGFLDKPRGDLRLLGGHFGGDNVNAVEETTGIVDG